MNSVWVVQKGEYNDRYIAGAFTDEEAAKEFAKAIDGWVDTDCEVDQPFERRPDGTEWWLIDMALNGFVLRAHVWHEHSAPVGHAVYMPILKRFEFGCFAVNKEEAVAVADERRKKMIADGLCKLPSKEPTSNP